MIAALPVASLKQKRSHIHHIEYSRSYDKRPGKKEGVWSIHHQSVALYIASSLHAHKEATCPNGQTEQILHAGQFQHGNHNTANSDNAQL